MAISVRAALGLVSVPARLGLALLVGAAACSAPAEPKDDALENAARHDDESTASERVGSVEAELGSDCPTAPEWLPVSVFWWRTTRSVDRFVWSSDGSEIAGLELLLEEKKPWLQVTGATEKRKPCHRLFVQKADGSGKRYIGATAPLQNGELFDMLPAGYFVVESFDKGNLVAHRWAPDGTRKLLATTPDSCSSTRVLPAPTGATMASVTVRTPCGSLGDPSTPASVSVQMLNAQGDVISQPTVVALTGYVQPVWTREGRFVVTSQTAAFSFAATGDSAASVAVPACTFPPTTSSDFDATGRMLGIVDGGIGVATSDPTRAFGCGL